MVPSDVQGNNGNNTSHTVIDKCTGALQYTNSCRYTHTHTQILLCVLQVVHYAHSSGSQQHDKVRSEEGDFELAASQLLFTAARSCERRQVRQQESQKLVWNNTQAFSHMPAPPMWICHLLSACRQMEETGATDQAGSWTNK